MTNKSPNPGAASRQVLQRVKTRLALRLMVRIIAAVAVTSALLLLWPAPAALIGVAGALAGLLTWWNSPSRHQLAILNQAVLAQHFNREFPELEESAQLLLDQDDHVSVLQQLQRKRVEQPWQTALEQDQRWLPPVNASGPLLLIFLSIILAAIATPLSQLIQPILPGSSNEDAASTTALRPDVPPPAFSRITITPPAYTKITPYEQTAGDIELPEGSIVQWELDWQGRDDVALLLTQAAPQAFSRESPRSVTRTVKETDLYRLGYRLDDDWEPFDAIHTVSVVLDQPPRLRILQPVSRVIEIPMNGPAQFAGEVRVTDDYGVASAKIFASVAKGSGEGVKFRDEVFEFDEIESTAEGNIYRFTWRLDELGMEPGDEVYWFAVATDEHEPDSHEARSDTVVVRWLDDEPDGVLSEGLAIDVLPDYFRSQRQIIIETEQLIADRDALTTPEFDDLSRELGQSQSDLKQRYGEFLGDEFAEDAAFTPAVESAPDDHGDEDEDHEEHEPPDVLGHDHDHADGLVQPEQIDTSGGADELIARFAHNHGAADIGPIKQRNPVGLMKRSISNMWQAELHLLLSDPETALPFEYEALKYLNLARQADRIYTRRLGFEPPPVSEDRRLTGELDEVQSRTETVALEPLKDDAEWAKSLLTLLSLAKPGTNLSASDRLILADARDGLLGLSQERPALIRQAALIERFITANRLYIDDCEGCLDSLMGTAWSLVPEALAKPVSSGRRTLETDPLPDSYLQSLRGLRDSGGTQ